jgi:hypothetical protein
MTTTEEITIGTHDGEFHCDEVLAVSLLRLLPFFQKAKMIRTRDPEILNQCTVVVDVGGEYDPKRLRFDHHQRGCEERKYGYATKLSSAGMVWRHFGIKIVEELFPELPTHFRYEFFQQVYKEYIHPVDQQDTGEKQGEASSIMMRVRRANPWKENIEDIENIMDITDLERDLAFPLGMVSADFKDYLDDAFRRFYQEVSSATETKVKEAYHESIENGENKNESSKIMLLPPQYLNSLFRFLSEEQMPFYLLFKDIKGTFMIRAVPVSKGSFQSRKPLPETWRGLTNEILSQTTGIPDCVFVHATGFIGGHKTQEGAMAMAKLALEMKE